MIPFPPFARRLRLPAGAALSAAALLLGACEGGNLFRGGLVVEPGTDGTAPVVELVAPVAGSIVALEDSVRVVARVTDNRGIASVQLTGFALRGDANLGTRTRVERFEAKTVVFDASAPAVSDTTLTRDLVAVPEFVPESRVYVVATVKDGAGNESADTVLVSLGGPRVRITSPAPDSALRAGSAVAVRLSADDRADRLASVRVRTSGAFAADTTLRLLVPEATVDTVVLFSIPAGAQGELDIDATATSTQRTEGMARTVRVRVEPASADATPPRVSFSASIAPRLETSDSVLVTVTGVDETRVDTLGATVLAIRRTGAGEDTVGVLTQRVGVSPPTGERTFRLGLGALGLSGLDTLTLRLEVTGFAKDAAGNCATATAPRVVQTLPCLAGFGGATVSDGPGAATAVPVVRGRTVPPAIRGDTLADLASDRVRVFASNRTRNRVEVLPVGALSFASPVLVGSQPWGLALSPDTSTLLVANSGGAGSISRVPITPSSVPATEDLARRIVTDNAVLFHVRFQVDSESGRTTINITPFDFSDRPQFLAQTATGQILYSTVPTEAARPGTVQSYNPNAAEPITDIFVEYARRSVADEFVIRRADNVGKYILGSGTSTSDQLFVCDHAPGAPKGSLCFPKDTGTPMSFHAIQDSLRTNGSDAILDYNVDPTLVGLSDTTFLAVSKDHRSIAVGEGVLEVGRILAFAEDAEGNVGMVGNTTDLVNNASDRVKGLTLNRDGSVGLARGNTVYLFRQDLRKLGESQAAASGAPTGGVAMHPHHPDVPLAFVSGVDGAGRPFIDVMDTRFFSVQRRVFIRSPVIGTMVAVPTGAASGVLVRVYAITGEGVVAVELNADDLRPVGS